MLHLPKQVRILRRATKRLATILTKEVRIIVIWKASRTEIESDRPLRCHQRSQSRLADRLECMSPLQLMRYKLFVQMTRNARGAVPAILTDSQAPEWSGRQPYTACEAVHGQALPKARRSPSEEQIRGRWSAADWV